MKLRHANYNEIRARSTCHVLRERAVLDLIALRKHDTQRLLLICAKKSISNLHVVGMLDNLNFFSYHAVLPISGLWSPSFQRSPKFSVIPPFWVLSHDWSPLMRFAVILQLIRGRPFDFWRGGGGAGEGIGDFRKKYPQDWSWANLARKYLLYNSFVCQGKTFYHQRFWGKKFLRKPMKSPIPCLKSLSVC